MNKSELIRLISQNKIKECIDALFSDKDDALIEYQDTLINLSRRYTEYESKRINRTEHSDKLEVEINLISSDLLQLIKLTKSEQSDTISNEEDKETEQKNEINDRSKDQTKNIKEEKVEKNKGLKGWLQFVSSKITGKDNLELADLLWLILFAFFVVFTMIVFMSKIQGDISSVLKNIIYAMCTIIFISLSFKYLVFSPLKWVNIIF